MSGGNIKENWKTRGLASVTEGSGFFNKQKSEDKILSLSPGVLRGKGETENRAWKYEGRHLPEWQQSETAGQGGQLEARTVVQTKMLVKQGRVFLEPWCVCFRATASIIFERIANPPLHSDSACICISLETLCFWWLICTICSSLPMGPQPQINYMMKFLVIQKIWAVCDWTDRAY